MTRKEKKEVLGATLLGCSFFAAALVFVIVILSSIHGGSPLVATLEEAISIVPILATGVGWFFEPLTSTV